MSTTELVRPALTQRPPLTIRGAQLLLFVPLGLFQLVASIVFSITLGLHSAGDWTVASWAWVMSASCAVTALRLGRQEAVVLRTALLLLAAQAGFSVVKLAVYHESASFVFMTFVVTAAGLLVAPPSRRHFLG